MHNAEYLWATGVALLAGALGTFASHWVLGRTHAENRRAAAVIGFAGGVAAGFFAFPLSVAWPPANAFDRFFAIVLPTALVCEIVTTSEKLTHRTWQVLLRLVLIGNCGWILLFGSVYLRRDQDDSPNWQGIIIALASAALLVSAWLLMSRLMDRTHDTAIPISIAQATLGAGLLVMMAGYLKGGSAAFPLAAALIGVVAASSRLQRVELTNTVFVGLVGLFGIVFIGRFFGRLPTGTALVVFFAPLSGWVCEIPLVGQHAGWKKSALRLIVVAIPIAIVLIHAWFEFKREFGPLL